jgi:DNA anti-recombination protein RmuC
MQKMIDELGNLGKEIEKAKTSISQLEGRKVEVTNRLKEEFGITTLPEVEKLLAKSEKELETLEASITADFTSLKESFQW